MKREDAMKLVEDGIASLNDAIKSGKSEALQRLLATLAQFHNYSFGNAILIARQRPDATQVAGFQTWKKLGRYVKKGEQGIAILAPMVSRKRSDQKQRELSNDETGYLMGFKVAYVFDVAQTDGEPLPELSAPVGHPGEWLDYLEDSIRDAGILLEYGEVPGGAHGLSTKGKVIVRPDLAQAEKFAVLAHEFAHELLHQRPQRRHETTRCIRETEAEAVAYAVCLACGVDSTNHSADYIQLYRGNTATLRESLTFVQQTAAEIIATLRSKKASVEGSTLDVLAA
jgi:antirestriction protein ArdC